MEIISQFAIIRVSHLKPVLRYPLIFLGVLWLCLCDASKKQAKERALDMEVAAEKMVFFEEATGV